MRSGVRRVHRHELQEGRLHGAWGMIVRGKGSRKRTCILFRLRRASRERIVVAQVLRNKPNGINHSSMILDSLPTHVSTWLEDVYTRH